MAWLLDNSIPVPLTGGRRVGIDGIIGFVPLIGDIASAGMGLFVVWRASRMGLPRIVIARMLVNTGIDTLIGLIPFAGDAFDLWFKSNTRNIGMMRRHVSLPDASTREDWIGMGALIGAVVGVLALVGWVIYSVISSLIGLLS